MSTPAAPPPIRVRCRTNLDGFAQAKWPTELPGVPTRGDMVEAEPKPGGVRGLTLKIVGITWRADGSLGLELHR